MNLLRADQSCRVQRVNDIKKRCKWSCYGYEVNQDNEMGVGKCAVKCLMEMTGVYSRFGCGCVVLG